MIFVLLFLTFINFSYGSGENSTEGLTTPSRTEFVDCTDGIPNISIEQLIESKNGISYVCEEDHQNVEPVSKKSEETITKKKRTITRQDKYGKNTKTEISEKTTITTKEETNIENGELLTVRDEETKITRKNQTHFDVSYDDRNLKKRSVQRTICNPSGGCIQDGYGSAVGWNMVHLSTTTQATTEKLICNPEGGCVQDGILCN